MAIAPGVDPRDLAQAGWGVIFHEQEDPEIREALKPLLEHRKSQATSFLDFYREFSDDLGLHEGDSKEDFLARNGANFGLVNPDRMPYYLLIVGDPKLIPFQFQQQLDVQYAVGRVCFDTPEEYARYARNIVEVETGGIRRDRRITLFGACNPDDLPTKSNADHLIRPLADNLETRLNWESTQGWEVTRIIGEEATKDHLRDIFQGKEAPALFLTASHGMSFSYGDPLQKTHQGALLCQDWPGPKEWQKSVPSDFYFSGDDIESDACLQGMIAFHLASHSAGTLPFDEFILSYNEPQTAVAPFPFVAHLPQRMLGHPNGGALAVIGHVGKAWPYSFLLKRTKTLDPFETTIRLLRNGFSVGYAMEYSNQLYGELSADLALALQKKKEGDLISPEIAELWMALRNVQNFIVLGDPAVRLALS
jgi:hypothetical protein